MNLLKQPLVQFLLLGSLIFALDFYVAGRQDDPRRILINDARYAEIAGIYRDNQGRDPTEQEMSDLVVTWAQNEVLYREARLMGLDKGDEMIRQRLVLKLRNVLFNQLTAPDADRETLLAWFEENRDRYDRPATYDFAQFKVGGLEAADTAAELAASIGDGAPGATWQNRVREYEKRPEANLAFVFGEQAAAQLVADTSGRWHAVSSPAGWHLARVTARYAGEPADFEAIRTRVGEDYKSQHSKVQLAEALHGIASRYDVRVELSAPPQDWDAARIEEARLAMRSPE